MGCVQTKASAPQDKAAAKLPTLLSKTQTGCNIGHGKESAVSSVTAVEQGTTSAVTTIGNYVQQVGAGASGAICKVGEGTTGAMKSIGSGLKGSSSSLPSEAEVENEAEKTWYEGLLSFDPLAWCQPATEGNMLGSLVNGMLERFDSSVLGVDVKLGSVSNDPATGRVEVDGFTVFNPKGWNSAYLLHADRIVVDVEMEKLLHSFGKELELKEVVLDGVDAIYEKGVHTSNLNDLLRTVEFYNSAESEQAKASDVKPVLHMVLAQNIGAKLATTLTSDHHGLCVEVGDVKYDDFGKEMGAGRGVTDVIRVLAMTLIKSILATVVGKENTKAITGAPDLTANCILLPSDAAHGFKDAHSPGRGNTRKITYAEYRLQRQGTVQVVRKGCFSRQSSKASGDVSPWSVSTRSQ